MAKPEKSGDAKPRVLFPKGQPGFRRAGGGSASIPEGVNFRRNPPHNNRISLSITAFALPCGSSSSLQLPLMEGAGGRWRFLKQVCCSAKYLEKGGNT